MSMNAGVSTGTAGNRYTNDPQRCTDDEHVTRSRQRLFRHPVAAAGTWRLGVAADIHSTALSHP
jgi:hypothetical protein